MPRRKSKNHKKYTIKPFKVAPALKNEYEPKIFHKDGFALALGHNGFEHTQHAEAESWLIEDEKVRNDKASRETIRYPLLKKQMGLNFLDTSKMTVLDLGCGPTGGVSTIIPCKKVVRIDPLMDEYKKYYPIQGDALKGEDLTAIDLEDIDLIICTNCIDHFDNPSIFLGNLGGRMKPGAYFAHVHAIDNAITHKHEAHAHNVNPELFRQMLSEDFECVWYMDYLNDGLTYGWRKQPAFSGLYRKVTGYK
jgi:SAM-dependent methyltransferase